MRLAGDVPARGSVVVSPYDRFPRTPRWRRELRIALPVLALAAFAALAVGLALKF